MTRYSGSVVWYSLKQMGLGIAVIQNIVEMYSLGYFKNSKSILEIGSQQLSCTKGDIKELFKQANLDSEQVDSFKDINNFPAKRPKASAKPFYNALGLTEYSCIDINEQDYTIGHDLNKPFLDKSKFNKYDVVTDFGSCEHVFNIAEAYKTMHNLLKPEGYFIVCQGVLKANGYFLFDNSFFAGFAAANNYKIISSSYLVQTKVKTENQSDLHFHIPLSRELFDVLDYSKLDGISIYVVMQKQEDKEFKMPYQHSLMSQTYNFSGYNRMYHQDPIGYSFLPVSKIEVRHLTFKKLLLEVIKRIKIKFFGR